MTFRRKLALLTATLFLAGAGRAMALPTAQTSGTTPGGNNIWACAHVDIADKEACLRNPFYGVHIDP